MVRPEYYARFVTMTGESIEERFRLEGLESRSGLLWRGGAEGSGSWRRRLFVCVGVAWVPLFLLSLLEGSAFGHSVAVPFLEDAIPFARLLVALPIFLVAESFVDRRTTEAVRYLKSSGLVPADRQDTWQAAVSRIGRLGDSRIPGVVMVILALALSWSSLTQLAGTEREAGIASTWFWRPTPEGEEATWAGYWYALVSNCIYCFFTYRWLWRFALWGGLLRNLSKISLHLQPTHPDGAGGLGFLWRTQGAFLLVATGLGASLSGSLAYEILHGGESVTEQQPVVAAFAAGGLILVFLPLLLFTGQLLLARERGLVEYSSLGEDLSGEFRAAWIEKPVGATDERIVDSVHPSSAADYSAVYGTVTSMRVFPFSLQGLAIAVGMLVAPFVPLLLLEMPLKELLEKLAGLLT